jgi:DNA/RNA endonuclease G (NUC1)
VIGDPERLTHQKLSDLYFSTNLTPQIRDATNKAWALGDDSFIEQVANTLSRRAKPLPQGGDRRSRALTHQKLSDLYFSTNLTPQIFRDRRSRAFNSSKIK